MRPLGRGHRPVSTSYDEVARRSAAVVIAHYSTSFGWATRMLDEPVRTHVRCIYALVRVADELVDDEDQEWGREDRAAVLDGLHQETLRAVASGCSANLVVHAFALTAREHGIRPDVVVVQAGALPTGHLDGIEVVEVDVDRPHRLAHDPALLGAVLRRLVA